LPPYEDYSMQGRTYKYMKEEPLYPFGYGLSYTTFRYSDLKLTKQMAGSGESVEASVVVSNTGTRAGDEVVQCYLTHRDSNFETPAYDLKGFQRVMLAPGESRTVKFSLPPEALSVVTDQGEQIAGRGELQVTIAGASPGARALELGVAEPVSGTVILR
jgi:beta-glucosidase